MESLEAISRRRSVRSFRPDPIGDDTLEIILDAGMRAPVASGRYDSLHITVVEDPGLRGLIGRLSSDVVFEAVGVRKSMDFGAPVIVVVSSSNTECIGYANAAAVIENMLIAATDLGLGSLVWGAGAMAIAHDPCLVSALGIPRGFEPLLCASFGCPADDSQPKTHEIPVNRIRCSR